MATKSVQLEGTAHATHIALSRWPWLSSSTEQNKPQCTNIFRATILNPSSAQCRQDTLPCVPSLCQSGHECLSIRMQVKHATEGTSAGCVAAKRAQPVLGPFQRASRHAAGARVRRNAHRERLSSTQRPKGGTNASTASVAAIATGLGRGRTKWSVQ